MEKQEVEKLAHLARLTLSPDELEARGKEIGDILGFIETLSEAGDFDESDVIESAGVRNVMQPDENPHESGLYTKDLIELAPDSQDDFVKVKKIL